MNPLNHNTCPPQTIFYIPYKANLSRKTFAVKEEIGHSWENFTVVCLYTYLYCQFTWP